MLALPFPGNVSGTAMPPSGHYGSKRFWNKWNLRINRLSKAVVNPYTAAFSQTVSCMRVGTYSGPFTKSIRSVLDTRSTNKRAPLPIASSLPELENEADK